MAFRKENEILYKIFQDFINLCIMDDKSLLWPERESWSMKNINEIKKRMVDAPMMGNQLSFEEKLISQMKGASPSLWAVIADIYYIYFLPSTFITIEKKKSDIHWAVTQGNLPEPEWRDELIKGLTSGFTRTSQKYHFKYSQFWFIILLAYELKNKGNSENIVKDHNMLKQLCDYVLGCIPNRMDRAYDMRHAVLYMAFPEYYERIISTRHKEQIVKTFSSKVNEKLPSDYDEAIQKIRGSLSSQYDTSDDKFDFYQKDIQSIWKTQQVIPIESIAVTRDGEIVTVPDSEEPEEEKSRESSEHTRIQYLLLKLGNEMGLDIWVARNDKKRMFDGFSFTEFSSLKSSLPVKFDEVTNKTIELIDVLWLKGNAIIAAFEIESTTSVYSGILRMADLISMQPNINIPLYIVAPDDRKDKVIREINRPVFSNLSPPIKDVCSFISFSSLTEWMKKYEPVIKNLKPDFIEDLSEPCSLDDL